MSDVSIESKKTRRAVFGIFARSAGVALLAAAIVAPKLAFAQACEDPKVLRFSIIPTQDSVRELSLYKPVMDLLSKNTGKKIEFYLPTSYSSVVEAMIGKWVDIAMLGPESYVIAHNQDPTIEVFATYYKKKDGVQEAGPGYKSMLITKKGSKFTTIESTKGTVLLLVDPASTSGALIPQTIFSKTVAKMPLKDYYGKIAFSGGHDLSTLSLYDGKADAAFVATHRFMNVVHAGKVKVEDFNILWSSPLLPQDPFVWRNTLCAPIKEKILQTFLTLDSNPDGQKYLQNVESEKFVKMTDADYNIIREAGVK
jgi:phosphonate transport system substrate-binding protein